MPRGIRCCGMPLPSDTWVGSLVALGWSVGCLVFYCFLVGWLVFRGWEGGWVAGSLGGSLKPLRSLLLADHAWSKQQRTSPQAVLNNWCALRLKFDHGTRSQIDRLRKALTSPKVAVASWDELQTEINLLIFDNLPYPNNDLNRLYGSFTIPIVCFRIFNMLTPFWQQLGLSWNRGIPELVFSAFGAMFIPEYPR